MQKDTVDVYSSACSAWKASIFAWMRALRSSSVLLGVWNFLVSVAQSFVFSVGLKVGSSLIAAYAFV